MKKRTGKKRMTIVKWRQKEADKRHSFAPLASSTSSSATFSSTQNKRNAADDLWPRHRDPFVLFLFLLQVEMEEEEKEEEEEEENDEEEEKEEKRVSEDIDFWTNRFVIHDPNSQLHSIHISYPN